jgi:uncharacterized membrane protein
MTNIETTAKSLANESLLTATVKKLADEGSHAMHRRSFVKGVSWRALGSFDTFIISWFITGQVHLGAAIAGTEIITKIGLYYFHERVWAHVKWGLRRI